MQAVDILQMDSQLLVIVEICRKVTLQWKNPAIEVSIKACDRIGDTKHFLALRVSLPQSSERSNEVSYERLIQLPPPQKNSKYLTPRKKVTWWCGQAEFVINQAPKKL